MNKNQFDKFNSLFNAMVKVESVSEARAFLEDLCTINELEDMTQRLEVCLLLEKGKNYNEISSETGASSATISRVRKCYQYSDGYKTILKKLNGENK